MQDNTLIKVQNLSVEFPLSSKKKVHAVSNVSLDVKEHEVLALVGESGCGKSTLGKAMIQLIKPTGGEVSFRIRLLPTCPQRHSGIIAVRCR